MRPRRLVLAALVALALSPGIVCRSPLPPTGSPYARAVPLAVPPAKAGPLRLAGAWEIVSDHRDFGGFSALVIRPDGTMMLGTDAGRLLTIPRPDRNRSPGGLTTLNQQGSGPKVHYDLEALTFDPVSRRSWGAYETSNRIVRFAKDMAFEAERQPPAMADWGLNAGAEAFTRLPDGRFVAIEEQAESWGGASHRAVLFAGDPTGAVAARSFTVIGPKGYRPVDAVALDQHRLLVLFRSVELAFPPRFGTALGVVDIAALGRDEPAVARVLAVLAPPIPDDNFEGMALTHDGGATQLWLVSDDNFMHYQRTLVLKFDLQTRQKARE